ncbi:biogenesis of lysosome-related organelles complex 1 subunit 5-like [Littorina saxatilis]|uniref:Biogenesis of lysosome-related organelles complex 1 subunit 5 n=1 Tax=Littorina saxatilis TaxID=31220 RepID=A0AAN9AR55_9CAEN
MSCENIFKGVCHIHARLFDHRSALQGHINFFAKEFEEKRGDREKTCLDQTQDSALQCRDHTLPTVQSNFSQHFSDIAQDIKKATDACKVLAEKTTEEPVESKFLKTQRDARRHALDQFMEQQCVRSGRIDQQLEENIKLFNASFEELRHQLSQGVPFTSQTYYKFMALGKELS